MQRHLTQVLVLILALAAVLPATAADTSFPALGPVQLQWIGERIYTNECNRQPACLTAWNEGEDFPSMGIGHFIWYRAGQSEIYTETFPDLMRYLDDRGHRVPAWVRTANFEQPWSDRATFLQANDGAQQVELRQLLEQSLEAQTAFIVQRFHAAIPDILAAAPPAQRETLGRRLLTVALSDPPRGVYALIDYVHFKGEGTSSNERYQGQGWGLLQVLEAMPDSASDPLAAFVQAADTMLTRRVANAPVDRNEQRWLAGWRNRLATYRATP